MAAPMDVETPAAVPAARPVERAGPARLALFAAMLSPMVLVLVGFVGSSFDPATRTVARLSALALLLGMVSSLRRWRVGITAACLAAYALGVTWVFALPDGRHPTLMAVALLSGVLVAIEPYLDGIDARDRSVVAPVAAVVAIAGCAWVVAMSPLPLRLKIAATQATMDERAARDLAESVADASVGGPARPSFECVGGQVPNLDVGPFQVCHRSVDRDRSLVVYDLGKPFLGLGDKTTAGLVYAPGAEPQLRDTCLARITGAWYEYTRPADGGACPPGQHRED